MDVARYLYLIILGVMMENLLPGTGTMAVTYVHCAHTHTPDTHDTHKHKCAQVSLDRGDR